MKKYSSLRHNKHLVRIVRTEDARSPYAIGNAYGDESSGDNATTRRLRILDHWGQQSQSPRRPEPASTEGILPKRNQQSLFFDLDENNRDLLTRRHAVRPENRREARPGTKQRLHRGENSFDLSVESSSHFDSSTKK